ncbi:MAG: cell division protein FtsZ [Armatimonadota bacterium]|nr:cell division protein FtsZ [Armatimonadota bacterium]MDT7971664.1 cell division protein FtsZ [Armatimonadota bacterium]
MDERRRWVADNHREDGAPKPVDIRVIGIGGAGSNAVNRMVENGVTGVELIAINTDAQALSLSKAHKRLQIGTRLTNGRGAGGNPQIGRQAAEEDRQQIASLLEGAEMVFLAAGMGGGTGTGATPVVAQIARERGILTVAVVTKPFAFEGKRKMEVALQGINELRNQVDALIIIPNQRLFELSDRRTTMADAFRLADEVLTQAVQGITDLIVRPGLINVDFADVRAVLENAGTALMGVGYGSGENRAVEAAQHAIASPLLEASITGARNVLFTLFAPPDLLVDEVKQAADIITNAVNSAEANVIWGLVYDEALKEQVRITLIATGFGEARPPTPSPRLAWERREEALPKEPVPSSAEAERDLLDEETLNIPSFLRRPRRG